MIAPDDVLEVLNEDLAFLCKCESDGSCEYCHGVGLVPTERGRAILSFISIFLKVDRNTIAELELAVSYLEDGPNLNSEELRRA